MISIKFTLWLLTSKNFTALLVSVTIIREGPNPMDIIHLNFPVTIDLQAPHLDPDHLGCVLGQAASGGRAALGHLTQDVPATLPSLGQGLSHDVQGDALDLDDNQSQLSKVMQIQLVKIPKHMHPPVG